MKPFPLFHHYQSRSNTEGANKGYQTCHVPDKAVTEDKTDDGSSGCGGSPVDIATLNTHELKGFLQPLEYRVSDIFLIVCSCHDGSGYSEEQRQGLGCCNEEDTGADNHHDLLLEILSIFYKLLIHSIVFVLKQTKETNWKQKNEKLQNENICLTNLNVENNGNFPILTFVVDCWPESTSLKIGFIFDVMKWVRIALIWQEKMPNRARDPKLKNEVRKI